MSHDSTAIPSAAIDFDAYVEQAKQERKDAMRRAWVSVAGMATISKRDVGVALTASTVWAAVFWATAISTPHQSVATPVNMAAPAIVLSSASDAPAPLEPAGSAAVPSDYWPCGDGACDQ